MTEPLSGPLFQAHLLGLLAGTVRALGSVLPRNTEVVLHDLRTPEYSIAEIANGHITGRRKGDSVLAGMRADLAFSDALEEKLESISLLVDYPTLSKDGQPLRSSTALYRDLNGKAFAALCINVDQASVVDALNVLQGMVGHPESSAHPPTAVTQAPDIAEPAHHTHQTIDELMREIIRGATELSPGTGRTDIKRANLLAVSEMQDKGIFLIKGGVEKAAAALGVTRYSIYNYLAELKGTDRSGRHFEQ
ncbi:PAS domain-containing protein [Pseudomonas sp. SWRI92]|nr:PAS domain-containing protein [Pseudomonas sp. SWRI92]